MVKNAPFIEVNFGKIIVRSSLYRDTFILFENNFSKSGGVTKICGVGSITSQKLAIIVGLPDLGLNKRESPTFLENS